MAEDLTQQQFQDALESRDIIGQAKGVLMVRRRITAATAFAVLVAISQRTNTRVRLVAEQLIDSLPSADVR